jgi:hypothetical protein
MSNQLDIIHIHYQWYGQVGLMQNYNIPLLVTYHMDAEPKG